MVLSPRTTALIEAALDEDVGMGDVTTRLTVRGGVAARAVLVAREALVLAGSKVFEEVFRRVEPTVRVEFAMTDGDRIEPGAQIATVAGPAGPILTAERVALNFLQRLCGIATLTRRFVDAVPEGARARIADTRKTTPGWRELERHAVRSGGGFNHRADLAGGVLIKDNHVALAGGVGEAVRRARALGPHPLRVEVEARTLAEADEAVAAGAEIILLDNMDLGTLSEAVARIRAAAPSTLVEASGGVHLGNVAAIAQTGVDVISVGALTHSAPASDLALKIQP